jgi:hypothetical protein
MCDPAWLRLDLTARQLRVLLALSLHADWSIAGTGRCYPKRETIAAETGLQVSQVSEAVRALAEDYGVLTVVRLGRKNIYYVRPVGADERMPPSGAVPFFEHLRTRGVMLLFQDGKLYQASEARTQLEQLPKLYTAVTSDYIRGLPSAKLHEAVLANRNAQEVRA